LNPHIFKRITASYVCITGVRCNLVMRYEHSPVLSLTNTADQVQRQASAYSHRNV